MKEKVYIGVDVSKAELEIRIDGKRGICIPNKQKDIMLFIRRLKTDFSNHTLQICYESTGVYGYTLLECSLESEVGVSILNPKRVKDWARGIGEFAKTDKIDARVIYEYSKATNPRCTCKPERWRKEVMSLFRLKRAFMQQKIMIQGHLEQTFDKQASKILKKELTRLEKKISKIEEKIFTEVDSVEEVTEILKRLTAIKGIGKLTAITILVFMPEIGTLGRKRAAALAGLAPYADDSGKKEGQRKIYAGRSIVREALYMPALSAIQHNHVFKSFYQQLVVRGKEPKVALTAVMRKMIVLMDLVVKNPNFQLSAG